MLRQAVGWKTAARFSLVLAGDVVPRKKPAPDIYLDAATRLGVAPGQCVVIEDSNRGLMAATSAGMKCIITISGYTRHEDFSAADLVLSSLGDPDGETCRVLAHRSIIPAGAFLGLDDLALLLSQRTGVQPAGARPPRDQPPPTRVPFHPINCQFNQHALG
jgi:hypothetical protein